MLTKFCKKSKSNTLLAFTLLSLLLSATGPTSAQTEEAIADPQSAFLREDIDPAPTDEATWKELTEGVNFTETPREKPKKKEPKPTRSLDWSFGITLFKIFVYLFVLLLIIAVVYYLVTGNLLAPSNRKVQRNAMTADEIEDDLENTDPTDFLAAAKARGDYALALRLCYLALIRALAQGGHLQIKRDKTNGDYLRELRGTPFYKEFRDLTATFERSRYGDIVVGQTVFEAEEIRYRSLWSALNYRTTDFDQ